jgi:hypothetical protein
MLGVEDDDVLRLDVFQTIDDGALQLADVQFVLLLQPPGLR